MSDKRAREIQSLTDRLAALKANTKPQGGQAKKRPKRKSQASTPGTSGMVATPKPSGKGGPPAGGNIRLRRRELVLTLSPANGKAYSFFAINCKSFDWLKNLSKSFERVKFHMVKIWFCPAVGTTKSGSIAYGVDYSFKKKTATHSQVVALTPSVTHPVWQGSQNRPLVVPKSMLQSRNWYIIEGVDVDTGPGILVYAFDGDADITNAGDFWVEYDVELAGTVF